jgi:hypothetical protein
VSGRVAVADVLAVQDLLARYCWLIDEGRGEDWADLFTEDGVFEGTRPDPVIGRAALREVPEQNYGMFQGRMRHWYGNLSVEPGAEAGTLVARFYNQITVWDDGGKPLMLAISTATLVPGAGDLPWRIRRNSVSVLR